MSIAPLALTMGDPAGIGTECTLKAWLNRHSCRLPVFASIDDPNHLRRTAQRLGLTVPVTPINTIREAALCFAESLPVLSLPLARPAMPGQLDTANGQTVVDSITTAVNLTKSGEAAAVVTNPINKKALYDVGFAHPGHTEFLSALDGNRNLPVMMLANELLKAVPLTIHIPLQEAPKQLTQSLIKERARIVHSALQQNFGFEKPRLALAGLNPHAGEGGALGVEEIEVMIPAADQLRAEGIDITDPLPADTMFHDEARATYDVALCPTHDQALIPVKSLDFHGGVNVTLGLSFIRTSPDHGTALNIAAQGGANPTSLMAALRLAGEMAAARG